MCSLLRDDADPGFEVCEASLEDSGRCVESEHQELMSKAMAFDNGKIYIVEPATGLHEDFCRVIDFDIFMVSGTFDQHLRAHGSTYVESLRKLEPDCSFGPAPGIGAICPDGLTWSEYHTLKVEVGISRGWYQLDRRADQWRKFPGVQYILCIHLALATWVCEYKLFVVNDASSPLPAMAPIPIVHPTHMNLYKQV